MGGSRYLGNNELSMARFLTMAEHGFYQWEKTSHQQPHFSSAWLVCTLEIETWQNLVGLTKQKSQQKALTMMSQEVGWPWFRETLATHQTVFIIKNYCSHMYDTCWEVVFQPPKYLVLCWYATTICIWNNIITLTHHGISHHRQLDGSLRLSLFGLTTKTVSKIYTL